MAKRSVKSFLIADLLLGNNNHAEENREKKEEASIFSLNREQVVGQVDRGYQKIADNNNGSGASSPNENIGDAQGTSSSTTPSGSPLSTSEEERHEKTIKFYDHGSPFLKYETGSTSSALYPHQGLAPIVFPMAGHSSGNGLVETDSNAKNYPTTLPFGFDPYRTSRLMFGRHQSSLNPMGLSGMPSMSHGAPLPPGMEYSVYSHSHYPGLYGMQFPTSGVPGLYHKGSILNDRDNFPMYHLSRTMYAANCKRKGGQIRFTNSQTVQLEKAFVQQKYLNANDRKKLAHSLGLSDRQVKTWFQNRRAKLRKCKGGFELSGSPQNSSCTMTTHAQEGGSQNDNFHDGKKIAPVAKTE